MQYRHVIDPREQREKERAEAQIMVNQANIDYLAIMTGVPMDEDEEVENDEESL